MREFPGRAVVFLQDEADIDFASTYFNLPAEPVRLTIDTTVLASLWLPDLAAWGDLPDFDPWDSDKEGLQGTLDNPSPFDTLHYTGCICYRGSIPPSAILEALAIPLPDYLANP